MTEPHAGDAPLLERLRALDGRVLWTLLPAPPADARPSAVLLLLGDGPDGPDLVLTERAHGMRSHAAQIAFPGGAADLGDSGPAATALREAQEEIGLDPAGVDVLAVTRPLWLPPTNFAVTPVLGWWREESTIGVVDPAEVHAVLRVPLAALADPAGRCTVHHPAGYQGPGFVLADDLLLWGFTAGVVDRVLHHAGAERAWDRGRIRPAPVEATR